MKHLNNYIIEQQINQLNEGLLDKLMNWFKNLYKSQQELKENTLDVDVKNIKGPEKPTPLEDIEKNKEEMNLINDPNVGFPIMSALLKNKKKYLTQELSKDSINEYKPLVNRYFYVAEGNKYDIGIIMYDESIKNDNNYVNMINLEVIDQVSDKKEIQTFINKSFEDKMKKKYKGAQYTGNHPSVKGILITQQYKSENNNKDILFKNF
jgi:hypothetical protein